uniref:Uncharacterized protein n=1 Tax=Arundo donax TaxID=35708 RepID=A0A0A9EZA9_ARUDO
MSPSSSAAGPSTSPSSSPPLHSPSPRQSQSSASRIYYC